MPDNELVVDVLQKISCAIDKIQTRFKPIDDASDFSRSPEGMEKLDAICMQLIAIGESLKKIDKLTHHELFPRYAEIDWKGAKGLRDVIVHAYFDVDAEEIFWVCSKHMEPLRHTVERMISDLKGTMNED